MIGLADPKRIIVAAERKAEVIAQPMNIAVVDEAVISLLTFEWTARVPPGS